MSLLGRVGYIPILKSKMGEWRALGSIPAQDQDCILPLMVVPPAGDFDPEAGQALEPAEHLKRFGGRAFDYWGRRPFFVDAFHVDDERHAGESGIHPLTSLLGRAALAGARAYPATSLRHTPAYQTAVAQFVSKNPGAPICVRLNAAELEGDRLAESLDDLLRSIDCTVQQATIVVDLTSLELTADEHFVDNLLTRLNYLPNLHDWMQLAVTLTSFPEIPRVVPGERIRRDRTDWQIYQMLLACGERLFRRPIFSDCALEFPNYKPAGRATPRARFRYSTTSEYVIDSGTTTKKPHGYQAIFPVARTLASSPEFSGETFSRGDAFIASLAAGRAGPGQAWQWRWASTDHHLHLIVDQLRPILGLPTRATQHAPPEPEQALLL